MNKQSGTLPAPDGVSLEGLTWLDAYIGSFEETDGALIEILHEAQGIFGYLSRDVQLYIARRLGLLPKPQLFQHPFPLEMFVLGNHMGNM